MGFTGPLARIAGMGFILIMALNVLMGFIYEVARILVMGLKLYLWLASP